LIKNFKKFFITALRAAAPAAHKKGIDNILWRLRRRAACSGLNKTVGSFY